jgi:hypothetical protein
VNHLVDSFPCRAWGIARTAGAASTTTSATCVALSSFGAFYAQSVAIEVLAVELLDQSIGNFFVVNIGESKATTRSRFSIENGFEADSLPHAGELGLQLFGFECLRQVADVKTHAHETGEREKKTAYQADRCR